MPFEHETQNTGSVSSAPIQGKAASGGKRAKKISAMQGGEKSLSAGSVMGKMEKSFNADFSRVKLVESPSVASRGFAAQAQGNKVSFAPGKFNMGTRSGQELLGHELSHVVSHARGESPNNGGRIMNNSSHESKADAHGAMAARGQSIGGSRVSVRGGSSAGAAIQGKIDPLTRVKMRRSAPIVREAVVKRGMDDLFKVDPATIHQAETHIDAEAESSSGSETDAGEGKAEAAADKVEKVGTVLEQVGNVTGTGSSTFEAVRQGSKTYKDLEKTLSGDALEKAREGVWSGATKAVGATSSGISTGIAAVATVGNVLKVIDDPKSAENWIDLCFSVSDTIMGGAEFIGNFANYAACAETAIPGVNLALSGLKSIKDIYSLGKASRNSDGVRKAGNVIKSEMAKLEGTNAGNPAAVTKTLAEGQRTTKFQLDGMKTIQDVHDSIGKSDKEFNAAVKQAVSGHDQFAVDELSGARGIDMLQAESNSISSSLWRSHTTEGRAGKDKRAKMAESHKKVRSQIDQATAGESNYHQISYLFSLLGYNGGLDSLGEDAETKFKDLFQKRKEERQKAYDESVKAYYTYSKLYHDSKIVKMAQRKTTAETTGAAFDLAGDLVGLAAGIADVSGAGAPVGAALAGVGMVISASKLITTTAMEHHMRKASVKDSLKERSMHQQNVMSASEDGGASQSADHAGRLAANSDKLTNIDDIIQDIIDEAYDKIAHQHTIVFDDLHVTHDKSAGERAKKKHGRETTKLYKHMALWEMGVVSGFRADIHNNIIAQQVAQLAVAAKTGPQDKTKNPALARLVTMHLAKSEKEGVFNRRKTGKMIYKSLGDMIEMHGGDKHYAKLMKTDTKNPFMEEVGADSVEEVDAVKARLDSEAEEQAKGANGKAANPALKRRLAANRFAAKMMRDQMTEQEKVGLAEVTK